MLLFKNSRPLNQPLRLHDLRRKGADTDMLMSQHPPKDGGRAIRTVPRLDELPGEILSTIALYMTNDQLRRFRELYNRHITGHIDYAFAEAHFRHRICKVTNRSVNRLEKLRTSRFVKHIRMIEIRLDLHCRIGYPRDRLLSIGIEILDEARFFTIMLGVVRQAHKLRGFTIRAPSRLSHRRDQPLIARSVCVYALTAHDQELEELLHENWAHVRSFHGALPVRNFVTELVRQVKVALPRLEQFRVLGFAESDWQSGLAPTESILYEMADVPALSNLKTLDLQLEMFLHDDDRFLSMLAEITKRSVNLKVLRIRSGPSVEKHYRTSTENWTPLLHRLGEHPPFRLETLELDGLITSQSAPTLDQIIDAHSPTLRRLVLEHTNFHFPNTLRAFFSALASSNVNYYKSNWLYTHQTAMLVPSTLSFDQVPDEMSKPALHQPIGKGEGSDWGWIRIHWNVCNESTPVVYDNEDGKHGQNWMRDRFLNTISAIDCGAITDF